MLLVQSFSLLFYRYLVWKNRIASKNKKTNKKAEEKAS